ncbi:MAG: hypothetical protein ABJC26_14875 [Gemmatimonadaceae bacterium]
MTTSINQRTPRDPNEPRNASSPATDPAIDNRFFLTAAGFAIVLVGAGFMPAFLPGAPPRPRPTTGLVLVHAACNVSWLVLFATQVALIVAERRRLHRRLGVIGIVLALVLLALGFAVAVQAARTGYAPAPGMTSLAFLVIPIGDLVGFAVFVAMGLYWRQKRDVHKRLMWLATISIVFASVTRLPFARGNVPVIAVCSLLIVSLAPVYELVTRGRPHPASLWGGAALFASVPLRTAIGGTEWWHQFASWLVQ